MADSSVGSQSRQDGLLITAVVMTVIAATFVTMRTASRFFVVHNYGKDDYFILAAMTLTICYVILLFILREKGIGFPMSTLTPGQMVGFMKTTLAIQVLYYVNIFCVKTSILLTYLRFAVTNTFRRLCLGTIALHAVFFFICFVVTLSQCRPLRKMWDLTGTLPGSCINTTAFFYSTSTFNIITDIWILTLPFKPLRAIRRPNREKLALFLIFGAGAFACVASMVRLYTIRTYTESADPFRDGVPVNLWSMIELTVAITCASIPALKPIFSRRQRDATRAARSKSAGSNPYSSGTGASGSGGVAAHYTPQTSRFLHQPDIERSATGTPFSPGSTRSGDRDRDMAEARNELHFVLGFRSPLGHQYPPQTARPGVGDRDNTESSGFSLGLPMQTPPVGAMPPPLPRMGSHTKPQTRNDGVVVPTPIRPQPQRSTSQTSVDKGVAQPQRPAIPRRKSSNNSQRSVRIVIHPVPPPVTVTSPGERPGMGPRTASGRSLPGTPLVSAMRPAGPSKEASQSSFYLE